MRSSHRAKDTDFLERRLDIVVDSHLDTYRKMTGTHYTKHIILNKLS